jgi:hypothetical protein
MNAITFRYAAGKKNRDGPVNAGHARYRPEKGISVRNHIARGEPIISQSIFAVSSV